MMSLLQAENSCYYSKGDAGPVKVEYEPAVHCAQVLAPALAELVKKLSKCA